MTARGDPFSRYVSALQLLEIARPRITRAAYIDSATISITILLTNIVIESTPGALKLLACKSYYEHCGEVGMHREETMKRFAKARYKIIIMDRVTISELTLLKKIIRDARSGGTDRAR